MWQAKVWKAIVDKVTMLTLLEKWRWKENFHWILLVSFLLISFFLKISTLNRYAAPSGCDPGNYLFAAHAFQGNDIAEFGLRYPPVFYLLLSLALGISEEFTAIKVTAGIVSTVIGLPFFALARKLSDEVISLVCTTFFMFSFEYFGIPAWGGYGNLLGVFFLLVFLFFLSDALEKSSSRHLVFAALFFALILGTHVMVLIFTAFTIFVFALLIVVLDLRNIRSLRLRKRFKTLFLCGVMGLGFSLPFVPFYYLMLQDYSFSTPSNFYFDVIFGPSLRVEVIICLCITLVLLPVFYLYRRELKNRTTLLLVIALFLGPFLIFITTPTLSFKILKRAPVFWCLAGLLSVTVFLELAKKHLKKIWFYCLIFSLLSVSVIWFIPGSIRYLQRAIDFFQVIEEDELAALSWIKENTERSDVILCSGSSTERKLGWWVQGWAQRKTILTEESYWVKDFSFKKEREEAETASRILSEGDYILENGVIRVADYSFQNNSYNNSVIALRDIGKYQNLIYLTDSSVNLSFSTLDQSQKKYIVSPCHSDDKSIEINQTEDWGKLEYEFTWEHATIKRTDMLERATKHVDISYEVKLINATMEGFEFRIFPYVPFAESATLTDSSLQLVQNIEEEPISMIISLKLDDVECIDFGLDVESSSRHVFYKFFSTGSRFRINIEISFQDAIIRENQSVMYYNIKSLLENSSIDYVLIDKSHEQRCVWLRESGYFSIILDGQRVSIFKVNMEETIA